MDLLTKVADNVPTGDVMLALGAALAVSALVQLIKRWAVLQSEKVITGIVTVLAFLASAIDYIVSEAGRNPSVLGEKTAVIVGLSTLVYRYLIKPTSNLMADVKTLRQAKKADTLVASPVVAAPVVAQPVVADSEPVLGAEFGI